MSSRTQNAAQTKDHWVADSDVCQDDECELAETPGGGPGVKFSKLLRRHHCRFCGKIFCYKCAGAYITLSTGKGKKPFRTCKGCLLRYDQNCFDVELRLGNTQRALPESDPRVEEWRGAKAKGWGAALSWSGPPPVFLCKVYVSAAVPGKDLDKYMTAVSFDLKPGLRTPREKFVVTQPGDDGYEYEFLADVKVRSTSAPRPQLDSPGCF